MYFNDSVLIRISDFMLTKFNLRLEFFFLSTHTKEKPLFFFTYVNDLEFVLTALFSWLPGNEMNKQINKKNWQYTTEKKKKRTALPINMCESARAR